MSLDRSWGDMKTSGDTSTADALWESNKQGGSLKGKAPLKQKSGPDMDQSIPKVMSTLKLRVMEFGKASKDIRTLAEAVRTITQEVIDLKWKNQTHRQQRNQVHQNRWKAQLFYLYDG